MDQIDLTDIYRVFYHIVKYYTSFSAVHGTFSKVDPIQVDKENINKYKQTIIELK
jgi:hypothetical protein